MAAYAPAVPDSAADRLEFDAPPLAALQPASDDFAIEACDELLDRAEAAGASDLHLQPRRDGLAALIRIGGTLRELATAVPHGDRLVARMKVLAGLLTYRTDIPQEGRIARPGERSIRLATCPTVLGEKAVLRWTADSIRMTLPDLGLPDDTLVRWRQLLSSPQGLLLVTGPAGSGKTTTAYASLRAIQTQSPTPRSLVSLEDPVEAILDGVAQTQLDPAGGWDFADGLRSALRHDPEVLLVGEIRDADTLATAIRGSLTGHLILSTMHTGSPAEAITRLLDMGIEPYLIASSVRGVLQQQLVRRVDGQRQLLCDLLDLGDAALTALIKSHPTTQELTEAIGSRSVREQAEELLRDGRIDETEFVRVFGVRRSVG